ncbi:uncharacterized protein LOC142333797 [Lycorma delicatula]|uniref:uncharacterized protein LOC142333797 n=1 Tax=Lycorma delicatula TaxID=130591 RepID=UPI003F516C0D
MNGSVNNIFSNEDVPLNKNIKLETEQDNVAQMISFFLPHHMTETNTSHEHQVDLVQLKEEPVNMINGDIPKDPLSIEENISVKSKNVKVENEVESEISLNDKVSPQLNLNMKTNELEINDLPMVKTEEEMKFYSGHQVDLLNLKEELLDISNGDIEKDPLAIEETDMVKLENLKVESKVVTIDKGNIKKSIKISNEWWRICSLYKCKHARV